MYKADILIVLKNIVIARAIIAIKITNIIKFEIIFFIAIIF